MYGLYLISSLGNLQALDKKHSTMLYMNKNKNSTTYAVHTSVLVKILYHLGYITCRWTYTIGSNRRPGGVSKCTFTLASLLCLFLVVISWPFADGHLNKVIYSSSGV
jgi:hypothetical protein